MNKRIRELRLLLKMTQEEFSKEIGISSSQLSKLENGKLLMSKQLLSTICSRFSVNPDWIISGYGPLKNSSLNSNVSINNIDPIKLKLINVILNIDTKIINDFIKDALSLLSFKIETSSDNIENSIQSYRNELESEKKGGILSALLSIKGIIKRIFNLHNDFNQLLFNT